MCLLFILAPYDFLLWLLRQNRTDIVRRSQGIVESPQYLSANRTEPVRCSHDDRMMFVRYHQNRTAVRQPYVNRKEAVRSPYDKFAISVFKLS